MERRLECDDAENHPLAVELPVCSPLDGSSSGDDADVVGSDAEVTEPPADDEAGANTDDADEPDDASSMTTGPADDAGAPGGASGCVASSCNNAATCLLLGTAPCCTTSGACGCDYSYGLGLLCQ